jgi:hypothetical protein
MARAMARVVSMNSSIRSTGLDLIGVGLVIVGREGFPGLFAAEHDSRGIISTRNLLGAELTQVEMG